MHTVRLNKALASAGVCSRRKADDLIVQGKVSVNNNVVTELGISVDTKRDLISVEGNVVQFTHGDASTQRIYLALNKPIQVVSTAKDPDGRPTVLNLLPEEFRQKRLYPVGRLDYFSEGLIFLTNDGDFTNRLTHPRYHLPKVYEVHIRQKAESKALEIMRKGMRLNDGTKLAPVKVECLSSSILMLTLYQGINRQIRRMFKDLGFTILRLRRVSIGPIQLGQLPVGKCRVLSEQEITSLLQ